MRALLSVYDKTGIVEFAQGLHGLGVEIISTGGTAAALRENGVPVVDVSDVTGFPECLDGRVKTLHPAIHAGILAMRGDPAHMTQIEELGIEPIDIVAINLYPFKKTVANKDCTLEEAIENIDIGGPTMLRAAAKNWQDVAVAVDPADYELLLDELKNGGITRDTKFRLAAKVFEHTAAYDALITQYFNWQLNIDFPQNLTLTYELQQPMRYGENPHQKAAFYRSPLAVEGSLATAKQLHGKELSYNNIGDAEGALSLLREFEETAVVAVKHANPCGVGVGFATLKECWQKAYEADPVSVYGGIVACNRAVDAETAGEMSKIFLEIIIAPSFDDDAFKILSKKKNIRLLELPGLEKHMPYSGFEYKGVRGGLLAQETDNCLLDSEKTLEVVTKRKPTQQEMTDALLAWRIVKHVKSNGIAVAREGQSLGVGPGQVNRIWPTLAALERSGDRVVGATLASDAFFPFDDCVEAAGKAGITCIIQPGGATRDEDSIKKADEYGIAMMVTGMRHFKH
ncbi:MAG: bifunctional phosphoribosylaminoimidazolecarboxamide formyltransferase/IMP cyclohydrolase [Clostridia bacterium]|nr:bifunctional phosphoribosylaminoimidazolecarboxamide formyltransferase/IMP cyclohydrolase [Clostridia bacterium]